MVTESPAQAKRSPMPDEAEAFPDYAIRWQNFRGFADTGWLTLPPLTILIGPNNSGKTSVITPLLLMNQTLQSRDASTPIVTRGSLLDAGSFQNLLTEHDLS